MYIYVFILVNKNWKQLNINIEMKRCNERFKNRELNKCTSNYCIIYWKYSKFFIFFIYQSIFIDTSFQTIESAGKIKIIL